VNATESKHRAQRWSVALFDLDGTLVDTRPGILAALRHALEEVLCSGRGAAAADLSLPLDTMLRSAAPGADDATLVLLGNAFRRHYDADSYRQGTPYDGAHGCLADLSSRGVRCFVVTNKRTGVASRVLAHHGLATALIGVYGQSEEGAPVGKADLARRCLCEHGLIAEEAVVIGDSVHDEAMAADLGCTFFAAAYGIGPLEPAKPGTERRDMRSLKEAAAAILQHRRRGGDIEP
jgi:phosphoglycolate phosphatase